MIPVFPKKSEENTLYGEVKSVGESSVTIEVGTMKEMEKDGENPSGAGKEENTDSVQTDEEGENQPPQGGEAPSADGEAPEKPEDTTGTTESSTDNSTESSTGSDSKDGEEPGENPPEQQTETITLDDISEGDTVSITLDEDGNAETITVMSMGGGMGQSPDAGGVDSYAAATEYTSDTEADGETFTSTGTDENAVHILDGAQVTLKNVTADRTSSDSKGGDNSSFYGVGAAILNTDGKAYISGSTVDTDAAGGAGIFSYGDGVTYVSDTTIKTQQDTSGGIHAAGGGTMVVDGGTYTSNGTGSPAIYSTANIAVNNANLTANGSEAVCIEGLNSLHLYNSNLTGNMSDNEQNDCTWNVILYQSMSGDSELGNSTFEMDGGSLTAKNGGMFYTTNTESTFVLSDVDITYAEDNDFFLKCTGNQNQRGWGQSGSNGADCLFTAITQKMEGDIIWDSISKLDFYMTDGSTLKGAVKDDESCAGDGGSGYASFYIEEGSSWVVTGDSELTNLYCAGTITDEDGNSVTIKGSDGTVYAEGTSEYTITVDKYEKTADLSGCSQATQWSDYETEKPEQLS
ncbi:MAG: hypothetical protein KHY34_13520 [Lachnospiraceae bacterium]|nr:hypothetical protein [Lachnospiraceae bacterium]